LNSEWIKAFPTLNNEQLVQELANRKAYNDQVRAYNSKTNHGNHRSMFDGIELKTYPYITGVSTKFKCFMNAEEALSEVQFHLSHNKVEPTLGKHDKAKLKYEYENLKFKVKCMQQGKDEEVQAPYVWIELIFIQGSYLEFRKIYEELREAV